MRFGVFAYVDVSIEQRATAFVDDIFVDFVGVDDVGVVGVELDLEGETSGGAFGSLG